MLFPQLALAFATFAAWSLAAPSEFLLKTTGSNITAHNNLYVEAYHTGAGMADAVLTTVTANAGHFYLNETYLQMDIGQEFSYGFDIGGATNYAAWEFVTINAGQGYPGFELENKSTLTYNSTEFGGWLGKLLSHPAS
ncbi:conserved hypothetical protein [Talaromyces stipitatus ATCC 10500]|uniref:DUF7907 domain-containing protein n=1 Tax=Talaromyces stipitatus (strain ATCC 10500 / CBS 375.48 / QM 6759 / NRRL 1006) TaxID=441959 RepID=B8MAY5_TALSN|nr:uncharacterized protein TSTA_124140 [Talaromyces stipitatus ATCC 10500]EED18686.1 conserved hypothetical protein [Talaromyces stipitatus ATCC 10500]